MDDQGPTLRVHRLRGPAERSSAGFFFLVRQFAGTQRDSARWQLKTRRKMKYVLSAIALSLLLTTAARAEETSSQPVMAEGATEDCSKQVWPNFSPACLRNTDRTTVVRLVTTSRR